MKNILLLAMAAALCIVPAAQAATFTVTRLADSGTGSLRAAVAAANAAAGADTIRFQNGLAGTITLSSGEIVIADSVSIEGPGPANVAIAGTPNNRLFRLDRTSGPRSTTVLSGLTLFNGHADNGGAIHSEDENLIVRNTLIADNVASNRGGAIWMAEGDLTLEDVVLNNNAAAPNNQGAGGAIQFTAGTLRLVRSLVSNNSANFGGGVRVSSPRANLVIEDSLFLQNEAFHTAGGLDAGTMSTFRISRSAFVGNITGQPYGGAIEYAGATDAGAPAGVIENSTFSANKALHDAGRASAISLESGALSVRNSTFAFNQTSPDLPPVGEGGTIHVPATNATLNLDSTLFAHNTHGNAGMLVDISHSGNGGSSPSVLNLTDSLLHTMPAAGVINGSNLRNQFATDALLQPLTVDLGRNFVPAHPIPLDSPAIDAGSNPANLTTDQRGPGFARAIDANACHRPLVARADVGAFEYRGDTIFCHGFEN